MIDRLYVDEVLRWTIDVRNAGDATAPPSSTGLTPAVTLAGAPTEVLLDTPELAPGMTATVQTECPYGTIGDATARADATGVVDESDETNNTAAATGQGTDGRCRFP